MLSALDTALALAAAETPVYPVWSATEGACDCGADDCGNPGKHPLGRTGFAPHGNKSAMTDPDVIRPWFKTFEPNIAVATGHKLGNGRYLAVLDIDPRHGGYPALAALEADHGEIPRTVTVETGGGGLHIYFTTAEPIRSVDLGSGLEIKGVGGSVVVPPSRHVSGKRYAWREPFTPDVLKLMLPPEMPPWLLDLAQAQRTEAPSSTDGGAIPEGARNSTLAKRGSAMSRGGADRAEIETALLAINATHCERPLPEREVRDIAKSVAGHKRGQNPEQGRSVITRRVSEVEDREVQWLGDGRIPLGAVTILVGQQGLGKSTLTLDWAAKLTRGTLGGDLAGSPSAVVLVTLEDHIASVVKPRLRAAGADLDLVHIVEVRHEDGSEGLLTLPDDLVRIEDAVNEFAPVLLVVDPVIATLNGGVDSHKDQHVRRVLAPLGKLAERADLAVLAVMHLNKSQTGDLVSRVGGSVGWTAAARSVLAFARHPEDPDGDQGTERVLVHAKSNWGPYAPTLAYRIEQRAGVADDKPWSASKLVETGTAQVTAADLLIDRGSSPIDDATEFLRVELADGPRPSREILSEGRAAGLSERTLNRAKKPLGIRSFKQGTSWYWELLIQDGQPSDHLEDSHAGQLEETPAKADLSEQGGQEDGHTHNVATLTAETFTRASIEGHREAA